MQLDKQNSGDGVQDGLDTILSMVQESSTFNEELHKAFGKKGADAILEVINFGHVGKKSFFTLLNISSDKFENFFRQIDFSNIQEKLGLHIQKEFVSVAAGKFRTAIIECLTRYQIFLHFHDGEISDRYTELTRGKGFIIYESNESGQNYIKVGSDFIPEANMRDDYYKGADKYLFFIGAEVLYYFNLESGELITITGEYEDTYIIDGKTYLQSTYPNCYNPTHSEIHCVEDGFSLENRVDKLGGYILNLIEYRGIPYVIESAVEEYTGVHKGVVAQKGAKSIRVVNLYSGEEIAFIEGDYTTALTKAGYLIIISKKTSLFEKKDGNIEPAIAISSTRINSSGEIDINHLVKEENVVNTISTSSDFIYVFQLSSGSLHIASMISAEGIGELFGTPPVSKILEIKETDFGTEIHYLFTTGERGIFLSADHPSSAIH